MSAAEAGEGRAALPVGVPSIEDRETRLDATIERCRQLPWRLFTPAIVARLLQALDSELDDGCVVPSIRHRMDALHGIVHAKIEQWRVEVERKGAPPPPLHRQRVRPTA